MVAAPVRGARPLLGFSFGAGVYSVKGKIVHMAEGAFFTPTELCVQFFIGINERGRAEIFIP